MSIEIGKMIEIEKADPKQTESIRVALAALAGPIVAKLYQNSSRLPNEADLKRVTTALEAVMTFSDNFTPSDENIARLDMIEAHGTKADIHQTNIQYIQAFAPAVDTIATFSFGQPEKKLVLDMCDRITKQAKAIRENHFPDAKNDDAKRCELGLVKALADLYTNCHKNAVAKLSSTSEPDTSAQALALKGIWEDFEKRAAIMAALAQNLIPGANTAPAPPSPIVSGVAATPDAEPASPVQPAVAQSDVAPPAAPAPAAQPETPAIARQQTETPPPTAQENSGYNPMSMFGSGDDKDAPAETSQTPPQNPPPQQAQPEAPPPPPPAAPPEQSGESESGDDGSAEGGDGNPMSFFKKGD